MTTTKGNFCRICLTTKEDDKICDSSCYIEVFIRLVNSKEFMDKLWLCMWCRTILRRTNSLIKLALQSEKILSQNQISTNGSYSKNLYTLSSSDVTHIDIPTLRDVKEIIFVNEENRKEINDLNEIYIKSDFTKENFNDIDIINHNSNVENTEIKINEVIIKEPIHATELLNEELENENNVIEINENTIKIEKETQIKGNKRRLKLDELKFEVKYLNLEEQLNELEKKKMKYKHMKHQCELCGVGFLTSDDFEQHKLRHKETPSSYKCSICSLHYKSRVVYSQHRLSHERVFSCLLCGTRINKWSNCVQHRLKCGGTVVYMACGECAKVFSDEHSLKIHARTHKLNNRYTCEQCARKFATKQRLAVHVRTHTGIKPFSCEHCFRHFSTHSNLKSHYSVHSDVSSHYCVECDTYYKTEKSLKRHLKESVRHVRDRHSVFSCKQCSKEFSSSKTLETHMVRHSLTTHIKCTHCDKSFSNKSNLNKHLKCIHRINL